MMTVEISDVARSLVVLEKKAETLSDAIHKIEQSLIGGGV